MYKFTTMIFFLALLSGCASGPLNMDQLQTIEKGLTVTEIKAIFPQQPNNLTTLHIDGADYLVQEYAMQTGSRQEMTMTCGQYGCTPIVYPVPITAPYYLIYRDNRLVTWGHLEELNRSDDPQILAVTDQISRKSKN